MTLARSALVFLADTPYYHCTCRCVRRAFLCGRDHVTGRSFQHRRGWISHRLALLTEVFAIELCAYALMSNHYHLVLRLTPGRSHDWSTHEVIERWCRLFNCPPLVQRLRDRDALAPSDAHAAEKTIALWRERLGSLSWFMRCLNECIARRANAEDGCTGRFWEGRYSSQALLDDQALLTAMAYVDLNPVRAKTADYLATSHYTSVQARIRARATDKPLPDPAITPRLVPFDPHDTCFPSEPIPFAWTDYLGLLDATGRSVRAGKREVLTDHPPSLLAALSLDADEWLLSVTQLRRRHERALGAPRLLQRLADNTGRCWLRGTRAARRYYAQVEH